MTLKRSLKRLPDIRLQPVSNLDVVVIGKLDAALKAALHFLHIVLAAAQRFDRQVFDDDYAAANQAHLAAALDVAVGAHAAGDVADARYFEDLADLGVAVQLFA